jgi:hypothetical protein
MAVFLSCGIGGQDRGGRVIFSRLSLGFLNVQFNAGTTASIAVASQTKMRMNSLGLTTFTLYPSLLPTMNARMQGAKGALAA